MVLNLPHFRQLYSKNKLWSELNCRMNDLNTDWAEWSFVLCTASIVLIITLHRSFPLPLNVKLRVSDGASSNTFQQIWICPSSQSGHLHRVLAGSQLAPAPHQLDSYTRWRTWWRRCKWCSKKQCAQLHCAWCQVQASLWKFHSLFYSFNGCTLSEQQTVDLSSSWKAWTIFFTWPLFIKVILLTHGSHSQDRHVYILKLHAQGHPVT